MKNLFILIIITTSLSLNAQIQNGKVREINSKRKPLNNVAIKFESAVSTTSDDNGNFRLAFSGKKAGDFILKKEITKAGYELVNEKAFDFLTLSSDDTLGVDIILAKEGVIELAKNEYYEISDKELLVGLEREKKALKEQLATEKITENEYSAQLAALQEQYDWQWKLLDELANKFARVNFDDVSAIYQEALTLFKAGKVREAITKMENTNLISRIDTRLDERKRILNSGNIILEQQAANEAGIREDITAIQLQADLYTLTYRIDDAEELYDQLLKLDSTDLEILDKAGDFFRNYHRYKKGLHIYQKIVSHPKVIEWKKANVYVSIGGLNKSLGNTKSMVAAYQNAFDIYINLVRHSPINFSYKVGLAYCYNNVGSAQLMLGNKEKALELFKSGDELLQMLYSITPKNEDVLNGLSSTYERIGQTYRVMGNQEEALAFFRKSLETTKILTELFPTKNDYKIATYIAYDRVGFSYYTLGKYKTAQQYFEDMLIITNDLQAQYPKNIDYKHYASMAYERLGTLYNQQGNIDSALYFFIKQNEVIQEISAEYPESASFANSLSISYSKLGDIYLLLNKKDLALSYFKKEFNIAEALQQKDTININYQSGLLTAYARLGEFELNYGNPNTALDYFEKIIALSKSLNGNEQKNLEIQKAEAITYQYIGESNRQLSNSTMILPYFNKSLILFEELYLLDSTDISILEGLASAHSKRAGYYRFVGNIPQALSNAKQSVFYFEKHQQNSRFKNGLMSSCHKLGSIYLSTSKIQEAEIWLKKSVELANDILFLNPLNIPAKITLSNVQRELGVVYLYQGKYESAISQLEQSEVILNSFLQESPNDIGVKNKLGHIQQIKGFAYLNSKNYKKAETAFINYVEVSKEIHQTYPTHSGFLLNYALSTYNLGDFYKTTKDNKNAIYYLKASENIYLELLKNNSNNQDAKQYLRRIKKSLRKID